MNKGRVDYRIVFRRRCLLYACVRRGNVVAKCLQASRCRRQRTLFPITVYTVPSCIHFNTEMDTQVQIVERLFPPPDMPYPRTQPGGYNRFLRIIWYLDLEYFSVPCVLLQTALPVLNAIPFKQYSMFYTTLSITGRGLAAFTWWRGATCFESERLEVTRRRRRSSGRGV